MRLPDRVLSEKVIPVVRGLKADTATELADALERGGITTLEVTLESPGAVEAIAALKESSVMVGAGTVIDVVMAEAALEAGAEFFVSPHLDQTLVQWAAARKVPYLPGAFTPTEVATAMGWGATAIKLFPANACGPGMVSSLLGPFPGAMIVPTGGITAENARSFLDAGAVAVGVGGWLTAQSDLNVVTERALLLTQVV